MSSATPAGFLEHASGLIVPEAHARTRKVVTKAEWRAYEQAVTLYQRLGLRIKMACERPGCGAITAKRTPDGGANLQCDCTDRVFTVAF